MKKLLLLMITMLSIVFNGCKKEDSTGSSSLVGTKWTASDGDSEIKVLEFTSASTVIFYYADKQMNISGTPKQGTYAMTGNEVKFSLSFGHNIMWTTKLTKGVVNGSFMEVYRKTFVGTENDYVSQDTYQKK